MTHSILNTLATAVGRNAAYRSQHAPFLPHQRISLKAAIWSLLLGVALTCPAILFLALFPVSRPTQHNNLEAALFPGLAILLHVLLGPLLEEVVYRGLFLQLARRYLSLWIAIVLSSAVFAVTHLPRDLGTVIAAFPFACLFAWMVFRSGSLYPGYLCHAMFNFSAMFVVSPMFGIGKKVLELTPYTKLPLTEVFPAWWVVLSLFMALTSFVMLEREFTRRQAVADPGPRLAANVT
jgi:membrane protease YdiL (CAAX protease family)